MNKPWNDDDFQYAIENTRVIREPDRRIASFGQTSFRFFLLTEPMDSVRETKIRDGRIEAERPQIVAPGQYVRWLLEGFGEQAEAFIDHLKQNPEQFAILKYGFQFRKSEITEETVGEPIEHAVDRVERQVRESDDPLSAIICGVDDAWEVCLLKFTIDMISRSADGNLGDFRRRGLI
jgi:hypothetical protein